jgi:hypothetical protein
MTRTGIAFAVSPAWVPLFAAPVFRFIVWPYPGQAQWVVMGTAISAIFAYGGCVALGLPIFWWFTRRGIVSFWIAPSAGFVIGAITWLVFMAFFALMLGGRAGGALLALADAPKYPAGLLLAGGLGALVGATIWTIARPDRWVKQDSE